MTDARGEAADAPQRGAGAIPVVVVAGFLGAGKTTLLNHLLRGRLGVRVGVIVNDFGSVGVDAMLTAGRADAIVPVGEGCLCCAVDEEDLTGMLERLSRRSPRLDAIVIEASGVADPRGMISRVLAASGRRIRYGGLVTVLDAAEFEATQARHPELETQLPLAALLVLNKVDRVGEAAADALQQRLRELAPGVPQLRTTQARVPLSLLFDAVERPTPADQLPLAELLHEVEGHHEPEGHHEHGEDHSGHLHAQYSAVAVRSGALHPERLMAFLDALPSGVYRVKGHVWFGVPGYRQRYWLHGVGGHRILHRDSWGGMTPSSALEFIGIGLEEEALRAGLAECAEAAPGSVPAAAMAPVLRYLQR